MPAAPPVDVTPPAPAKEEKKGKKKAAAAGAAGLAGAAAAAGAGHRRTGRAPARGRRRHDDAVDGDAASGAAEDAAPEVRRRRPARAGSCPPRPSAAWPSSAVGAAIVLGGGGDDPERAAATTTATPAATAAGHRARLRERHRRCPCPAGWSDGATAEIPGFDDNAVTMGGAKGGTIVFGYADETAANPTLLRGRPARRHARRARRSSTSPATLQAAKYADLPIGSQTGQVFAVPTDKGVATLACIAEGKTCDAIASSLKITDGKAFPVGPSETLPDARREDPRPARQVREVRGA